MAKKKKKMHMQGTTKKHSSQRITSLEDLQRALAGDAEDSTACAVDTSTNTAGGNLRADVRDVLEGRRSVTEQSYYTGTYATAPYNFIPLGKEVILPPLHSYIQHWKDVREVQKEYADYIVKEGLYSGYFDIRLTNKTPLYIQDDKGKLFRNGTCVCIPGSSMRGSIKNVFKIITGSAFRDGDNPDFTNRRLYYRSMASGLKSLRESYVNEMVTVEGTGKGMHTKSNALPGFLVKEGKQFFVCPAKVKVTKRGSEEPRYECGKIRWIGSSYDRVEIHTGWMRNKKHFYTIYSPQWDVKISVPDDVIRDYVSDTTRRGTSLLEPGTLEKIPLQKKIGVKAHGFMYVAPCFYMERSGQIQHFGAGPYYRIPYKSTIANKVPGALRKAPLDFTDALFGYKEYWASRVQFEDLYLEQRGGGEQYPETDVKALMTPNPTSFQFYLQAPHGDTRHWDEDSTVRGYKMYWHGEPDWKKTVQSTANEKVDRKMAPLKENHVFTGKVRFRNISAEELGALAFLFALGNEADVGFKLGMGKPLGLGIVTIESTLYLQDKDYYAQLFDDKGFARKESAEGMEHFIQSFEAYVTKQIGKNAAAYNAYLNSLASLYRMLDMSYSQEKAGHWKKLTRPIAPVNGKVGNKEDGKLLNKRIPLGTVTDVVEAFKRK